MLLLFAISRRLVICRNLSHSPRLTPAQLYDSFSVGVWDEEQWECCVVSADEYSLGAAV